MVYVGLYKLSYGENKQLGLVGINGPDWLS